MVVSTLQCRVLIANHVWAPGATPQAGLPELRRRPRERPDPAGMGGASRDGRSGEPAGPHRSCDAGCERGATGWRTGCDLQIHGPGRVALTGEPAKGSGRWAGQLTDRVTGPMAHRAIDPTRWDWSREERTGRWYLLVPATDMGDGHGGGLEELRPVGPPVKAVANYGSCRTADSSSSSGSNTRSCRSIVTPTSGANSWREINGLAAEIERRYPPSTERT